MSDRGARREADHYGRVGTILDGAHELRGASLETYLDDACQGDATLRAEVVELLALAGDDGTDDGLSEQNLAAARVAIETLVDDATEPWLPEKIGDYVIVRQIGQGGMGIVYEATQKSPRRTVAIKLLHPIHATPDRLKRFRQEAELLGRLQHPGIAQIHEAGTYDVGRGPQPFIAMELISGIDIRTHCERNGLDRAARIELLARVADAVQYAHDHGVVHRDLKPDNVLVNERGRPVVLDFGIARATDHTTAMSTVLTEKGQLVGTLAYMAPEQFSESQDAITEQADVFALGVLGFELLVGRLPRNVEDLPVSKAIAILTGSDPPRASTFDSGLKGDVETILGKALEPDVERRYPTAAALAADIRRHLADHPIEARPPSRIYLVRKFTRRHRGLVAGAVATLVTLVTGIVIALVLAKKAQDKSDMATKNEEFALEKANQAINGLLQSAQTLIDAGRARDAVTPLRLVPQESRGLAWRLLDRAVPFVMDTRSVNWRFVDDEHLVGVDVVGDRILLYSLLEHRTIRELFLGAGILGLWGNSCIMPGSSARCRVVPARTKDETLLLDLDRETVLARSPLHVARGKRANPLVDVATYRCPEVSDDGRTVLWYTSETDAEVRVDGEVVRVIRGLTFEGAAHLGSDGRDVVVNRRGEISVIDVATGSLRLRHRVAPGSRTAGFPVRGGVLLFRPTDRCAFRQIPLTDEMSITAVSSPFASGFTRWGSDGSCSKDGRVLAIHTHEGDGAYLVNAETGAPLEIDGLTTKYEGISGFFKFPDRDGSGVVVAPSGRRLAICAHNAQTRIVELDPRLNDPDFDQRVRTLRGHADKSGVANGGWIYHLAISNDGSLIASAAPADPLVRLWDVRSGDCIASLERPGAHPSSRNAYLAFSRDDHRLLLTTPYEESWVGLVDWDLMTGDAVMRSSSSGHHLSLLDALIDTLSPRKGARLSQRAQMQDGRALVVFNRGEGAPLDKPREEEGRRWAYVPGLEGEAAGLSIHPGARRVAVVRHKRIAGEGGTLRDGLLTLIDTSSGEVVLERDLDWEPMCAAYSPDGSVLAIGTNEGHVLLFETDRYTQQLEWRAHKGEDYSYVYSLAWTPDGTRLVTASGDATLRIWDTRTRVASRLADDRWQALQAQAASRTDLRAAFDAMAGEEREAARVELIRQAHGR